MVATCKLCKMKKKKPLRLNLVARWAAHHIHHLKYTSYNMANGTLFWTSEICTLREYLISINTDLRNNVLLCFLAPFFQRNIIVVTNNAVNHKGQGRNDKHIHQNNANVIIYYDFWEHLIIHNSPTANNI